MDDMNQQTHSVTWPDRELVQAMQRRCPDVYVLPDREGDGFSFIRTNGDRLTRQQAVNFLMIMGVTPPDPPSENPPSTQALS